MSTSQDRSQHLTASQSRPRHPRSSSSASALYIPQPEALILPEGSVSEQAAELLQDLVHTHHHEPEDTLIDDEDPTLEDEDEEERAARAKLPWWKRPSPYWLMAALPFSATSVGMTLAPRIEVYTTLACSKHRPEYAKHLKLSKEMGLPYEDEFSPILPLPPVALGVASSPVDIYPKKNQTIYFRDAGLMHGAAAPENSDKCASDPEVQAAVAALTLVLTAAQGILACLTTVWWASLSDRRGRKLVMSFSVLGLLFNDLNFLTVSLFSSKLPGGYWLLLVGPIIEGLLGGMTSGVAAMHAYVSDTTDPGARSRTYSLFLGFLFTGIAVGPTLGAIIIRLTGSVLSVFFAAAVMHVVYALLVWVILPESRSARQMQRSKARHEGELAALKETRNSGVAVGLLVRVKRVFAFLSPLTLLAPKRVDGLNPLKPGSRGGRDWNLTFVAVSYGLMQGLMGSYPYKFQYALAKFSWSSEIIGYFLTIGGVTRALYLMVILPLIIKYLKPKPAPVIRLPSESSNDGAPASSKAENHSPQFDLGLARAAVFIDLVSYVFMGFAETALPFGLFALMSSLGAGFSPAVQAVALELYSRRGETETGKLFGALSVVNALSAQILGPAVFGAMYIRTVAIFPPAIFLLSALLCGVSFCLLFSVNLSKRHAQDSGDAEEQAGLLREGTLVEPEPEMDI